MEEHIAAEELAFFLDFAATTIQRHYRGYLVRRAVAAQLSAQYEQAVARVALQFRQDRLEWAARTIQGAWLAFRNKRIYQYYRDLVQFRERGDPREMLRAINPREAQLADAASGIHVRFRLGGTMFPPLVFYKIFTHRSIADINAFGPRNYAQEVAPSAKDLHNKPAPGALAPPHHAAAAAAAAVQEERGTQRRQDKPRKRFEADFVVDKALREFIRPDGSLGLRAAHGWYARTDNNGWRPVAERVLLDEDPVTTITRLKRTPLFHHNPAVRRAARAKHAKQRQRAWLVRLYSSQALQETLGSGALEPKLAALGALAEQAGSDGEDDLEPDADQLGSQADALLEWCQHLNFGDYAADWQSMACTLASEAFQPEPDPGAVMERALPPPSQNVRAACAAAGVPLQPFQGGALPVAGATSGFHLTH